MARLKRAPTTLSSLVLTPVGAAFSRPLTLNTSEFWSSAGDLCTSKSRSSKHARCTHSACIATIVKTRNSRPAVTIHGRLASAVHDPGGNVSRAGDVTRRINRPARRHAGTVT